MTSWSGWIPATWRVKTSGDSRVARAACRPCSLASVVVGLGLLALLQLGADLDVAEADADGGDGGVAGQREAVGGLQHPVALGGGVAEDLRQPQGGQRAGDLAAQLGAPQRDEPRGPARRRRRRRPPGRRSRRGASSRRRSGGTWSILRGAPGPYHDSPEWPVHRWNGREVLVRVRRMEGHSVAPSRSSSPTGHQFQPPI